MYGATTPCSKIGNSSIASEKVDAQLRALSLRWKRQSRKDFVIETSDGVSTTAKATLPEFQKYTPIYHSAMIYERLHLSRGPKIRAPHEDLFPLGQGLRRRSVSPLWITNCGPRRKT